MTTHAQHILDEAIGLSPSERSELVEGILSSFDAPTRAALDTAWAKESEDRIDAYERGEIASISAEKIFEKLGQTFLR